MAPQKKSEFVETFVHPAFGKCDRVPRYLAIRWKADAAADGKAALLQAAHVELATRVESIEWSLGDSAWRSFDDTDGLSDAARKILSEIRRALPKPGDRLQDPRQITLPTDGTLYEAELAHCSSCEPTREAEELIRLERMRLLARRECLQTELLALEIERRRSLAASSQGQPLELGPMTFGVPGLPGQVSEHP